MVYEVSTGEELRDKDAIKRQIQPAGTIIPIFRIQPKEDLEIRDRWIKLTCKTLDTTQSFALGHSAMGVLGTDKLGATYTGTTIPRVIQSENIYREWFYDDHFNDTVNTTASWDTTNHRVMF